ncbi:MAG: Na(+)-translocating NADH-quinone reductase subunit A [Bacteroidales bacterium]|nr:Na(+)-translocating NADH-quinone reductase subunit A [Bacteroidales bacterium]
MSQIKTKRGLNIRLQGAAICEIIMQDKSPEIFAIHPSDFQGLISKPAIQPGDKIQRGEAVCFDKNNPEIRLVSPVSGILTDIVRGEKRKILQYLITPDGTNAAVKLQAPEENCSSEDAWEFLSVSGFAPYIMQRPYGVIAIPGTISDDIFISFFDTAPLAPDYEFIFGESGATILKGFKLLSKITRGKIHAAFKQGSRLAEEFKSLSFIELHYVSGPHPAGNTGTVINKVRPINKGDLIFTIQPSDVYALGKTIETGEYYSQRIIALTGSEAQRPAYYSTIQGASLKNILSNNVASENVRVISGNVLTGSICGETPFLSMTHSQVTVIPEGKKFEMLGWIMPGFSKFSNSRTYFSWLFTKKQYRIDTNLKGGVRNYVMTGEYEKVCPLDIYPQHLIKSIIVKDIDKMEQLGIYEVIEEDLALCEFVCTSKTEVQAILREGLDMMRKEMN